MDICTKIFALSFFRFFSLEFEPLKLVKQAIAETNADSPKMVGKVMGYIMKDHRDRVEPGMVKAIAMEELS